MMSSMGRAVERGGKTLAREAPGPRIGRMAVIESGPLTLSQLEAHLWRSADLFRNKVSNQKDYILALLFFKRASDTYDEDTEKALEKLGDIPGAQELALDRAWHPIVVPRDHSWDKVRNTDEAKLGQALNDAMRAVAAANQKQLAGVFDHTDFNNKQALPNSDLAEILDHFNNLGPLTNVRVSEDMLGQAYEWLIAKFAAESGKGGGEFYTPKEPGMLMAKILQPRAGDHINDPTCGSGGLLLQCLVNAKERGVAPKSIFLYGQELNPETWAIARMNMLLHGAGDAAEIVRDDTLAAPAFRNPDNPEQIRKFDIIVANPPFSPKNWGHQKLKDGGDPFGRIKHLPPKSHGEMAFVQHMVASMNDHAKMAVILPNGCFFRRGAEQAVRKDLIDADLIECVIQLPKDLFYGAGIPACIVVCAKQKEEARQKRVLMIDAGELFERRNTKNALTGEGISKILGAYEQGSEVDGFSRWVDHNEVVTHSYNLLVRRYVRSPTGDETEEVSLEQAVADLRRARQRRLAAAARFDDVLGSLVGDE